MLRSNLSHVTHYITYGIRFRRIDARSDSPRVELLGYDEAHAIENVTFENVAANGRPLAEADVTRNAFVRNVRIGP